MVSVCCWSVGASMKLCGAENVKQSMVVSNGV